MQASNRHKRLLGVDTVEKVCGGGFWAQIAILDGISDNGSLLRLLLKPQQRCRWGMNTQLERLQVLGDGGKVELVASLPDSPRSHMRSKRCDGMMTFEALIVPAGSRRCVRRTELHRHDRGVFVNGDVRGQASCRVLEIFRRLDQDGAGMM